ncbi:MAG: pyridoxamine 5'-phosphate oxidase family protein, partial [Planctomycetes bacterium]|nr:pyridoxamine 5'-phosphate oxidase family protein [Planctomycetota bacterium]
MSFEQFNQYVTSVEELRNLVGEPSPIALKKERKSLDDHMKQFILASPFLVMSTYGQDGRCDASPRGDSPGFAHVIDEQRILVPDRPGNRRVDSLRNILETERIGLLFFVPGYGETLRINGRAKLIRDERWLSCLVAQGKRPLLAIAVEVDECFLQCAKALIRSRLWQAS